MILPCFAPLEHSLREQGTFILPLKLIFMPYCNQKYKRWAREVHGTSTAKQAFFTDRSRILRGCIALKSWINHGNPRLKEEWQQEGKWKSIGTSIYFAFADIFSEPMLFVNRVLSFYRIPAILSIKDTIVVIAIPNFRASWYAPVLHPVMHKAY